jgi:hypothetical protein
LCNLLNKSALSMTQRAHALLVTLQVPAESVVLIKI